MQSKDSKYVISYDIVSDRLRTKIAKELENFGKRIQYSVFECRLTEKQFQKLYGRLAALMLEAEGEEGSIRIYPLCQNCEQKIQTIGTEPESLKKEKEQVIVI